MRNRFVWSTLLQLAGLIAVAVGISLIYFPAGLVAGGLALGLVGWATGIDPKAQA